VALISNSSSLTPGTFVWVSIAGRVGSKCRAIVFIIFQERHHLKMTFFLFFLLVVLHTSVVVWFVVLSFSNDFMNVMSLIGSEEASNENEDETKARLLLELFGGLRLVGPGHPLSTFAKSNNLARNEKGNRAHELESIVQLKLFKGNILWAFNFRLLSIIVVRVVWVVTMMTIDHFVGHLSGIAIMIESRTHAKETNDNESGGSALDSLLVLANVGLGSLQFLDDWIDGGWLQHALLLWSSLSALQENRHITLHIRFKLIL